MSKFEDLEKVYGLGGDVASFSVSNPFSVQLSKTCFTLGKMLQAFSFFNNDVKSQNQVLDLSTVNALVDKNTTLISEIAEYRAAMYESSFMTKIDFSGDKDKRKKYLLVDYLLSMSLCYVEIPKYVTKDGIAQQTYDKFLVTKNPAVMGAWMGVQWEEMSIKYGSKVASSIYELTNGVVRYVKCLSSGKGTTISAPRNPAEIDSISTCIPLFMLHAFMKGLEQYHQEGILKFRYLKDNNTVRELCTTTNSAILMDYYKDPMHVELIMSNTDYNKEKLGGMDVSREQSRGYVRLPELGLSRYDLSGVRALSLARILSVEKITEVDRSFIDVDLDSCVANFYTCLDYLASNNKEKLADVYYAFNEDGAKLEEETSWVTVLNSIHNSVDLRNTILTTTFRKWLHMYMVKNPELFPYYTGKPCADTSASSSTFGISTMEDF